MKPKLITTEEKYFERCRVALTNAETHAKIAPAMQEFDYGTEKIAEGTAIYNNAKQLWELNKKEDAETAIASTQYKNQYDLLQASFKRDRDRAGIFLKKDPETIIKLDIKGAFPTKYTAFFNAVKHFYTTIKDDAQVATALQPVKITPEVATERLATLETLMAKRAEYDKELGESQDATKSKNAALMELKNWMDDFDRIAKVALYDQAQLLEVLGIFVRS